MLVNVFYKCNINGILFVSKYVLCLLDLTASYIYELIMTSDCCKRLHVRLHCLDKN